MLATPTLSLYVHIPWCVRKCEYCDFNSHAVRAELPEDAYVTALLADLAQESAFYSEREAQSIFIGGGTPSLFSAAAIKGLLDGIRESHPLAEALEITLEANPGTVEAEKFAGFREAGVNRLSLGIQSFSDSALRRLGRIHDGRAAVVAAELAHRAGFTNINLDLMFGLPGQTLADAEQDIQQAIALEPTHISYYQLTLEPNTPFYADPPPLPSDDARWEIQMRSQELLAASGYEQYEISAYAKSGRRCRHNLNYWQFGDYIGIGAGAHGKLSAPETNAIHRRIKLKHPKAYLGAAENSDFSASVYPVPVAERPLEFLMNYLRLREGFPIAAFPELTGVTLDRIQRQLEHCFKRGLLEASPTHIRASEQGWHFLDEILQMFVVDSNPEYATVSHVR